jgi:apolipoprotein N-acyltransferase
VLLFLPAVGFPLLAGAALGLSWCFPSEILGALFGWLSVALFVWCALSSEVKLRWIYAGAVLTHVIAFSWLNHTISRFGGFGFIPTVLIFTLFCTISAMQFPLYAWVARKINFDLKRFALTTPLAWCLGEFLIFRLFPWGMGHSQAAFLPFIQIADIGGVLLISFLMFWVVESAIRYFLFNERSIWFAFATVFFIFSISYGRFQIKNFSEPEGELQKIAVIQANVSIEDKHSQAMIIANTERYKKISAKIPGAETLIIWPESVITDFIPNSIGSVGNDARLPFFQSNNPLLIGALSYNQNKEIFNSAFAILNSGTVLDPYHKQILMPFGEFMPMASTFPFMEKLNPNVPNFTAGTEEKIFEYPMIRSDDSFYSARVSPLICYEDVLPEISRRATEKGAQLLVNITNDGWFGDSLAPYQHDLIARFRAIENRRFLVRSTNTGFTTLTAPTGKRVGSIPSFSEGTLLAEVTLMSYITLYTGYVKDWLGWIMLLVVATLLVSRYFEPDQRFKKKN